MFGMFDTFENLCAPSIQCKKCNKKISLRGDYFPLKFMCANCGDIIELGTNGYKFPEWKYGTDGKLVREELDKPKWEREKFGTNEPPETCSTERPESVKKDYADGKLIVNNDFWNL